MVEKLRGANRTVQHVEVDLKGGHSLRAAERP